MNKNEKKALLFKVNLCARKNAFHIIVSYFAFSFLTTICTGFVLAPVVALPSRSPQIPPLTMKIATFVLLFLALNVFITFLYGFHQILLRMKRGKFVTIGFLFSGWRNFKKISRFSALASFLICVFVFACNMANKILYSNFGKSIDAFSAKVGDLQFVYIIFGFSALLGTAVFLPLIFSFYIRYDEENLSAPQVFLRSLKMMKGHYFEFIGFVLRSAGQNIFMASIAFIVLYFLSPYEENSGFFVRVMDMIIEFSFIINSYNALVKMNLSIPFFYGKLNHEEDEEEENEESDDSAYDGENDETVDSSENEDGGETDENS